MNRLYVYLPCYNEAENLPPLAEEWLAEDQALWQRGYELRLICVDDKSTDHTLKTARALAASHPQIQTIAHPVNKNLGGVLDTSISHFLQLSQTADLMCFMDADNTHKPRYIHEMLEKLSAAGSGRTCVIASRYQPGSGIQGLTKRREWFSDMARLYYTLVFHVPNVRDYTCGYRLYTRPALAACRARYGEKMIERRSFACMMELLYKLHRSGCRFAEVPFHLYYDDKEGESKMNLGKTIRDSLLTAIALRASA